MATTDNVIDFFQGELDRALIEVREALGAYAKDRKISGAAASVSTLINMAEFAVDDLEGNSAFTLSKSPMKVTFHLAGLVLVWNSIFDLHSDGALDETDMLRAQQLSINQYIVHEILHIRQNLSKFSTVPIVKGGAAGIGLPMLDLAADMVSAWIAAITESHRLDDASVDFIDRQYVNALVRAYIVGAFVFDSRTNPNKRQRVLGLIISVVLVQAKINGTLNRSRISADWTEISPILCLNLVNAKRFNAIVITQFPGLLIEDHDVLDGERLEALWDHVGNPAVTGIIKEVAFFLINAGVVSP